MSFLYYIWFFAYYLLQRSAGSWLEIMLPLVSFVSWLHWMQYASLKLIYLVVHFCYTVFLGLSDMYLPKCWLLAVHYTLYLYPLYFSMLWPVRWHWLSQLERPGQSCGKNCAGSSALQMWSHTRVLVILLRESMSHLLLPFIYAYAMHSQKLTCGKIPAQLQISTGSFFISLGLSAALW